MEFKTGLKLASVILASTFVLAACGSDDAATKESTATAESETLQDGSYLLEEKNFDDNGWSVVFGVTVEDGQIKESTYDYVNDAGELKTKDAEYQKAMKDKVGTGPAEYIPAYNQALVDAQDPSAVEVVSGATHSHELFVEYAQQLVDAAAEGKTETIEIDN
ncbi:MAG: FMN-binding protein [Carnobacterium sp.]|mgnify:CR=1 FL=1|uniref:FMN-binding protein n=1 Tax=Carnobacterium sp. TaxID=48221 RepID=UPI003314D402